MGWSVGRCLKKKKKRVPFLCDYVQLSFLNAESSDLSHKWPLSLVNMNWHLNVKSSYSAWPIINPRVLVDLLAASLRWTAPAALPGSRQCHFISWLEHKASRVSLRLLMKPLLMELIMHGNCRQQTGCMFSLMVGDLITQKKPAQWLSMLTVAENTTPLEITGSSKQMIILHLFNWSYFTCSHFHGICKFILTFRLLIWK